MAGMKFEYDESGGKFSYFISLFYAFILLPTTYWLWPKSRETKKSTHPEDVLHFSPCLNKYQLLNANEPYQRRKIFLTRTILIIAWLLLFVLVYRVSLAEIEHKEYDPFAVLDIDREASTSEIKRTYRELSKKYHPDRGGDPEQFKEIAKAYKTLTDEEAKYNWKKFGNPDGPGVTHFGIALPKWLVDHQNSLVVLLIYTGMFMIILPVLLCIWWQKSTRYAGDVILTDTIRIYMGYFQQSSTISFKRIIMILSTAQEFARTRNSNIIDRPSDNIEIPKIIKELPDVKDKTKEGLFQLPYSIKTRTLIHAHFRRFDHLSDGLKSDQRYILKQSIYLLSEMINIQADLIRFSQTDSKRTCPNLDTIENTMQLSSMIVQALLNPKNPLLQLPHITESHLKLFQTKKTMIKSLPQFACLDNDRRRSILRTLSDTEYQDILDVLSIYPDIQMNVRWEVSADENKQKITTGAIVTLNVQLKREKLTNSHLRIHQSKNLNSKTCSLQDNNGEVDDDDEEIFLDKFQEQQRRKEKLETKEKKSHRVFCPFYPEIKQECWWLYVANEKQNQLISVPVYICSLKEQENIEVKFTAPKKTGHYEYSIRLRSDSYIGLDVIQAFSFDVEIGEKVDENHPQWDFPDENENEIDNEDDYAAESESDTE